MGKQMVDNPYADIIDLPHPNPKYHARMPRAARAAQFAPFAALVGYDDAVQEAARFTDDQVELDMAVIEELNEKLRILSEHSAEEPEVRIQYFLPDAKKKGGEYVWTRGRVKRVDPIEGVLVFKDKRKIPLQDIVAVENDALRGLEEDGSS